MLLLTRLLPSHRSPAPRLLHSDDCCPSLPQHDIVRFGCQAGDHRQDGRHPGLGLTQIASQRRIERLYLAYVPFDRGLSNYAFMRG